MILGTFHVFFHLSILFFNFFWASFISIFFMTYLLNVGLRGHQSLLVSKKLTFNLSGNNFFFTFSYDLVWLMYLLICYNFKKKMLKFYLLQTPQIDIMKYWSMSFMKYLWYGLSYYILRRRGSVNSFSITHARVNWKYSYQILHGFMTPNA